MNEIKWNRLLKLLSVLIPTSFTFFVILDNAIFAWSDNYQFVQHVMSMDTVESVVHWRGIQNPTIWKIAYNFLITCESLTFFIGILALYKMIKAFNEDKKTFEKAKFWGYITLILTLAIWFFGFIDLGGEWFKMWLSPSWNGQPIAAWLSIIFISLLILYQMPEPSEFT